MTARRYVMEAGLVLALAAPALAQETGGKWSGQVKTPAGELPIIVVVSKAADGKLAATLESPQQAPGMQIPVDSITVADGQMTFAMAQLLGEYKGKWDAAAKTWDGVWTQDGTAMELDLKAAP